MTDKGKKVSIFILIDALGWEYIKDRQFLDGIMTTRRKVKSLLGYSSAVIPSILSGKYPQEHGHWSLFYYSPETSPFRWTKSLSLLPKYFLPNRVLRRAIKVISKQISGYKGYFVIYSLPTEYLHLFDICEKSSIYEPESLGNVKTIFDILTTKHTKYKCYTYPASDALIFQKARTDLEALPEVGFYFLYLCKMDRFLHSACTDIDMVNLKIDWYENQIKMLYKTATDNFEQVNLYVFSDHGMVPTKATFDLIAKIDELKLRIPRDFVPMYDSTMARFWFFSPGAEEKVREVLATVDAGRILTDEELKKLGVCFEDHQYGNLIFLMEPGTIIEPSYMGRVAPVGMHGFHPSEKFSDAMLLSNREIADEFLDVTDFFSVMNKGIT